MTNIAVSGLLIFLSSLFSSLFVLLKGSKKTTNITWSLASFSVAVWSFGLFKAFTSSYKEEILFWSRFLNLAALFIPIFFFHFVLSFLDKLKKKKNELISYYIIIVSYFLVSFFLPKTFIVDAKPIFSFAYYPVPGSLYFIFPILYGFLIMYGIVLLSIELFTTTVYRQNQIKYLLIGVGLGVIGGATTFLPMFGLKIYPFGTYLVPIYVLTVAYAVIKHSLMDIKVAVTRVGIFVTIYTVILGLPFVFPIWYKTWLIGLLGAELWWTGPLVIMAVLATVGPFIYIYVDRRIEARLFKEQKRYHNILKQAAAGMGRIRDLNKLLNLITHIVTKIVKINYASIYLYEKGKDAFILQVKRGQEINPPVEIKPDNPVILYLKQQRGPLFYEEIKQKYEETTEQTYQALEEQMNLLKSSLIVPSFLDDALIGFLALGKKYKGQTYTSEDLDIFPILSGEAALAIENAQLFRRVQLELEARKVLFFQTAFSLAEAIEAKDPYTRGHTGRVTQLSLAISKKLSKKYKFDDKFFDYLRIASLLHDIGKIGTPEAILNKKGPLTEEERKKMQEHPVRGATILEPIKELETVILGVKYHHERFDGAGYPEGLREDKIPWIAAIISSADTFDAMTSDRPYRPALSKEKTIKEIEKVSGKQLHPEVCAALLELYHEGKI